MAELFNWQTNAYEDVDDSAVTRLVSGGSHTFRSGQQIPVINPQGKAASISADKANEYFNAGYRLEAKAELDARHTEEKYGEGVGNAALAGLAGAARGLSFGLSDVALTKSGLVEPETLEGLKTAQEEASLIGEIGGSVAPLLLSGGGTAAASAIRLASQGSKIGKVLGLAGSGVRQVAKIGAGTEKAVQAALGAKGTTALGKALSKATGAGVEGTIYGTGQVISEETLNGGDHDLTAEQIMGTIGLSALGGAATSGVLSGAASLASGTAKLGAKQIEKMWTSTTGGKLRDGVAEAYAKASAILTGKDEKAIARLLKDKKLRQAAVDNSASRQDAARKIGSFIDESGGFADDITENAVGDLNRKHVAKIIKKGNETEVAEAARGLVGKIDATIKRMEAEPAIFGSKPRVKEARRLLNEFSSRISDSAGAKD